jgi:hypothetical protein
VTRRTALPSPEDVHLAIKQLTETTGKPPTVLALAGHLGLANTTFRRHFPDLTADLTQRRSANPTGPDPAASTPFQRLQHDNAHLRATNRALSQHLELAVANIQRLTLDNHQLRHQLEAATNITRIDTRHRSTP